MNSPNGRILVVDDNRSIHADFRKILCPATKRLEREEQIFFGDVPEPDSTPVFELDFASQGQEAVRMASAACSEGRPYALAYVDVRMPPGWDGIETSARLWEIDPRLQIVICTAYSDYSWQQLAVKLEHADKFVILKKPFDVVEVQQLTNAFIAKWRLQQEVEIRERELQESERLYRFLANTVPGLVWTAQPDGTTLFTNDRIREYGGNAWTDNQGWGWTQLVHPGDLEGCMAKWTEAVRTGKPYEVEYRLKRAQDGQYRWHLGRAVPMRDAAGEIIQWVGTSIDIEDRKNAEAALLQSSAELERRVEERTTELAETRAELEYLLRSSPAMIYALRLTPPEGVRFVSENLRMVLGYEPAEFMSQPGFWRDHLHPEDAARSEEFRARLIATGNYPVEYRFRHRDGSYRWLHDEGRVIRDADGKPVEIIGYLIDKTERKLAEEELRAQRESFRALTDNVPDAIARIDRDLRFVYVNRVLENDLGIPSAQLLGKTNWELGLPAQDEWNQAVRRVFETGETDTFEFQAPGPSGMRHLETRLVPEHTTMGGVLYVLAVTRNVTEQKQEDKRRQMMELQLRQAQKLESIGQLAAGIAHEINTPTQYVADNTRFLKDSFESIATVLQGYQELLDAVKRGGAESGQVARLEALLQATDLAYLFEQMPAAIKETLEGLDRVTRIVRAMKEFSHPGGNEKSLADLNKAIESTVTVARNEWRYVSDLQLDLDPQLPEVPCLVSEFNQVILNVVINAAHAIGDVVKQHPGTKGTITVRTRRDGDHVEVRISDTGTGIPEAIRSKVFDPFFTTKDVGKGTGQGLSIAYSSIVKKHGGTLTFESEVGKGTTFIVRLPLGPRGGDAGAVKTPVAGPAAAAVCL